MLYSAGQSNQSRCDTAVYQLFIRKLPVCRACRMQNTGANIRNMDFQRNHLQMIDESSCALSSSLDGEGNNATASLRQIFLCQGVIFILLETRIVYKFHRVL